MDLGTSARSMPDTIEDLRTAHKQPHEYIHCEAGLSRLSIIGVCYAGVLILWHMWEQECYLYAASMMHSEHCRI